MALLIAIPISIAAVYGRTAVRERSEVESKSRWWSILGALSQLLLALALLLGFLLGPWALVIGFVVFLACHYTRLLVMWRTSPRAR